MDQESYGKEINLPALISSLEVDWACKYLDKWYPSSKFTPSKLLRGALHCLSRPYRDNNPDWLAQSAHSMREIFYNLPLSTRKKEGFGEKLRRIFHISELPTKKATLKENILFTQAEENAEEIAIKLTKLYNIFTTIAHHFTQYSEVKTLLKDLLNHFGITITDISEIESIYQQLIAKFVFLLKRTSENILEVHKKIDSFVKKKSSELNLDNKKQLELLLHSHIHAKEYFFSSAAPASWASWLNDNGFFEILKEKAEDPTKYSFNLSELHYLDRIVGDGNEDIVLQVMQSVDCTSQFNPEVIDQFLRIISKFSANSIVQIIPKIAKENWVELMRTFKPSGYDYQRIVKILLDKGEGQSIIILAEMMLTPTAEKGGHDYLVPYFYMHDVGYSEIFSALASMDGELAGKAMDLMICVLNHFIYPADPNHKGVFAFESDFRLDDVDLFNFSVSENQGMDSNEDLKNVLAALVQLAKQTIGNCDPESRVLYNKYFATLPDANEFWRLKLYVMSLCPSIFDKDLKSALNRLFEIDHFCDVLSGTEYYRCLSKVFADWSVREQRTYVETVVEYFKKKETEMPDAKWIKRYALKVLSSIAKHLTKEEELLCEEEFGAKPDPKYEPTARVSHGTGVRGIVDKSPVDFNDSKYHDVLSIVRDLRGDLTPKALKERDSGDNFFEPVNAEGLGNHLRENMKLRIDEYLGQAQNFLAPDLHLHYTHSFLSGVEEYLGENEMDANGWKNLFILFDLIKTADRSKYPEDSKDRDDRWLANWIWVEKDIATILKSFFAKQYSGLFAAHRSQAMDLIGWLLKSEDPLSEHENRDDGDLHTTAINSVRGIAFEAFVHFVCRDGTSLNKDVLALYRQTIIMASPSVRFVVGKHVGIFYSRNKAEVEILLDDIFPVDSDKVDLFSAAWDGYLSSSFYKEMFDELEKQYSYAYNLERQNHKSRRDPDEGLAAHLALAFAHFDDVQFTDEDQHPLLDALWKGQNTKLQKAFVSFLGRAIVTRDQAGKDWFKENNVSKEKLEAFWNLLLQRDLAPEVYAAFGYWINPDKEIFDYSWIAKQMAETLEKSKGQVDWDHGLLQIMANLVDANPEASLSILEKYLLDGVLGASGQRWFYLDNEKIAVFESLYKFKPAETKALINKLLMNGGKIFRSLKDIPKD